MTKALSKKRATSSQIDERIIDLAKIRELIPDTPMVGNFHCTEENRSKVEYHFKEILKVFKLDLNDDSLKKTPYRVSKMLVEEVLYGLDWEKFPKIMVAKNTDSRIGYTNALIECNISVNSMCEHHFQNISGVAHISYIPKDWIVGLSKFHRVIDFFCRRPCVQERVTKQIFETLKYVVDTEDVAVVIDAYHFCVKCRGVKDSKSITRTSALGGSYLKTDLRLEFFNSIPKINEVDIF